MKGHYHLQTG
jgi:hypothetical protein